MDSIILHNSGSNIDKIDAYLKHQTNKLSIRPLLIQISDQNNKDMTT